MLDAIAARLEGSLGRERVRRLQRSRVAVIGVGLLGGQDLAHLAMLQIATLIVDPGDVDAENLGNQMFPADALGEPKVSVRRAQMHALNPSCPVRVIPARVEAVGLGAFADMDLLLTGLDSQASRLDVNRIAARLGLDWIDAAVDGSGQRAYGTVTWYRPHDEAAACYGCRFDSDALAAVARERRPQPCANWRDPGLPDTPPTLLASPFGAVVAGIQMNLAIQALLGESQSQVGHQVQIAGGGVPQLRIVELARRSTCVFPHRRLDSLRRVECRTPGELVDVARQVSGRAPDALVFPDRPLVLGLACAACGTKRDLVKYCEAVTDAEVRCRCGQSGRPGEMGPVEMSNRLDAPRLASIATQMWSDLGIPDGDLVTAESGEQRTHYLLPRGSARDDTEESA